MKLKELYEQNSIAHPNKLLMREKWLYEYMSQNTENMKNDLCLVSENNHNLIFANEELTQAKEKYQMKYFLLLLITFGLSLLVLFLNVALIFGKTTSCKSYEPQQPNIPRLDHLLDLRKNID